MADAVASRFDSLILARRDASAPRPARTKGASSMNVSNTFEDRLTSLATRGFRATVSVSVPDWGEHKGQVQFSASVRKGGYGSTTNMEASGVGGTLDEAIGAALRAGEAYLGDPAHPQAIERALGDLVPALPAA